MIQFAPLPSTVLLAVMATSAAQPQIPADYKGRPFDSAKAMANFYDKMRGKEVPPWSLNR